jgi:hypothetical protein
LAVLVVLAVPAAAHGATVEGRPEPIASLHYTAEPGEQNRLTLSNPPGSGFVLRVHDAGAVLQAEGSCTSVDAHTVDCTGSGQGGPRAPGSGTVDLGDGDDTLDATGVDTFYSGITTNGGPGDDVLHGSDWTDTLVGGGGRDRLHGGDGINTLIDGDDPQAPDEDLLAGSPEGIDRVSYAGRTRGVTVDLTKSSTRAGERGEGDVVRYVESAEGGDGADRLVGSPTSPIELGHELRGNGGDDVLIGRTPYRFSDNLKGGPGNDRLVGGRGGDELSGGAGVDTFGCGRGVDVVHEPRPGELIPPDCGVLAWEVRFSDSLALWPHPLTVSRRRLFFRAGCPTDRESGSSQSPCPGSVSVRTARGRLLARGRFPGRGDAFPMSARLTPLGRRLARRPRGVVGRISLRGDGFPRVGWDARLRR